MKLLFSFVFCILLSIAFCDEGPQTSSRKDVFSSSNDVATAYVNDDKSPKKYLSKAQEVKSSSGDQPPAGDGVRSWRYHGDMATDDVNDDTPLSVMAHAYLRHNDERNSEDMKLVAEDTENDQFVLEFGDDGPPDNVADRYDDVADNVAEDTENDQFFSERLPRRRRRRGDNDAKINSYDVADNVADGDDGPLDNVADGDDDVADENDGSPDNVADGDDDVAEDTENDKFFPERRYGDNDAKFNSDNVADGDDDVADDNDDVADDNDDVADGDDDVADDDEEDDDVADENDEELTYHYIVYDQDPNNDEQIKEFYASDEIPDEVIEKIIADDYEEY